MPHLDKNFAHETLPVTEQCYDAMLYYLSMSQGDISLNRPELSGLEVSIVNNKNPISNNICLHGKGD